MEGRFSACLLFLPACDTSLSSLSGIPSSGCVVGEKKEKEKKKNIHFRLSATTPPPLSLWMDGWWMVGDGFSIFHKQLLYALSPSISLYLSKNKNKNMTL